MSTYTGLAVGTFRYSQLRCRFFASDGLLLVLRSCAASVLPSRVLLRCYREPSTPRLSPSGEVVRVLVPSQNASRVVGTKGANVKRLSEDHGTKIDVRSGKRSYDCKLHRYTVFYVVVLQCKI